MPEKRMGLLSSAMGSGFLPMLVRIWKIRKYQLVLYLFDPYHPATSVHEGGLLVPAPDAKIVWGAGSGRFHRSGIPFYKLYEETSMKHSRRTVLATLMAASFAIAAPAFAQKKIVVGFSQIGAESEWRTANTNSMKSAAAAAGIELKFSDAQQNQENQIKALRVDADRKLTHL
jgi:hypothetical protein